MIRFMDKATEPEPITVDVMGAARMLGLGRSTVLGLADSGELPRLRFGRRVVYAVDDIERLVEQRRSAAAREAGIYRLSPGDRVE
jgi:excisionase family DNA binding protein